MSWIGLGSLQIFLIFGSSFWNKQIGLDPENALIKGTHLKGFLNTLKLRGGQFLIFHMYVNPILFRLYGVLYRGCTRLEAVGLVCNFSGKLLTGIFSGHVVQFFLQPPCLETSDDKFFPLYSNNKCLYVVLFFLADGSCKIYLIVVPERSLEQLKKRKPCTKFIDLLV